MSCIDFPLGLMSAHLAKLGMLNEGVMRERILGHL